MAKVAKPMSLRVKIQMQRWDSQACASTLPVLHAGWGTHSSCSMLPEWGGTAWEGGGAD